MPTNIKNPLRTGYTTGSCAAAAAKACATLLIQGHRIQEVTISLPSGDYLTLPVADCHAEPDGGAVATVVKDAGDDPDITNGMSICARVRIIQSGVISIDGGQGIGRVTEPGLKIPVGAAAINPIPLAMIEQNMRESLPSNLGAEILIFAPDGEEIAKKTYNPRLGIIGGISIIGTTGIVRPMSEEAWKQSLALELSVVYNRGFESCVFAFGHYGERFAIENLGVKKDRVVVVSNFLGFMIDEACKLGFHQILLIGHIGKVVKIAGGIFHTHSRIADARMEILCCLAGLAGAEPDVLRDLYGCTLTSQAIQILEANHLQAVYSLITQCSSRKMHRYSYEKIQFGTVLFDDGNRLLNIDENGRRMIEDMKKIR